MILKRAVNRLLRALPAGEVIDGATSEEVIETVFRKSLSYVPDKPLDDAIGKAKVLDFGGGCGVHYKQAALLNHAVRWGVVETPRMARRADEISTRNLRFFCSITDAADWLGRVDLIFSNGALQYCSDPLGTISALCRVGAAEIAWRRIVFSNSQQIEHDTQCIGLSHCGPGISLSRKIVRNSRTLIPESLFLAAHSGYALRERSEDGFRFVALTNQKDSGVRSYRADRSSLPSRS